MCNLNCLPGIGVITPVVVCCSIISTDADAQMRITDGLVALYCLDEGSEQTIHDSSGFSVPLDLRIPTGQLNNSVHWTGDGCMTTFGNGICVTKDTVVQSPNGAAKIASVLETTKDITIEAWIRPANNTQGDSSNGVPIINMALGNNESFTLNQRGSQYGGTVVRMGFGTGRIYTIENAVQAGGLQHLVFTSSDESQASNIYVNNFNRASAGEWRVELDPTHPLALAGRPDALLPWHGTIELVAIYNRALSLDEIGQNYQAGPRCIPEPATALTGLLGFIALISVKHRNYRCSAAPLNY
jgi:hypothetical protein